MAKAAQRPRLADNGAERKRSASWLPILRPLGRLILRAHARVSNIIYIKKGLKLTVRTVRSYLNSLRFNKIESDSKKKLAVRYCPILSDVTGSRVLCYRCG